MDYRKFNHDYVVRIDKGEDVIESLTKLCVEEDIKLASVSGIGATDKVIIGLFNTQEKKYYKTEYEGDYEITGLTGNISTMNGKEYLHLHANISDQQNRTYGGHLNYMRISGTCEVFIKVYEGTIDREYSDDIGLNLIKF